MAEMRLLMNYFAKFDGKVTWEELEPAVEKLYHPEMTVVTEKGELKMEEFKNLVRGTIIQAGTSIEMLKLEKVPEGIRYSLIFHNPDGTNGQSHTLGTFKDGQLFRVEPDNPAAYSKALGEWVGVD